MRKNPLQTKIRARSLPRGVTPDIYRRTLIAVARGEREMPDGWEVDISWRNPATKKGRSRHWQTDEFSSAIENSNSGFSTAVQFSLAGWSSPIESSVASIERERAAAGMLSRWDKGWATRRARAARAAARSQRATLATRSGWERGWLDGTRPLGPKGRAFMDGIRGL
jgi:hypothetical protein